MEARDFSRVSVHNLIKKEETKGFVNNNVEKYTTKIKNLIEDAKKNGVDIQLYEKKIGCDNSELVVEKGIAIYTCNTDTQYIPTWKLAE